MKEQHLYIGRLVKDADQREIGENVVFNFTIAVDCGYTDKQGQWVDQAKFIECAFWRSKKSTSGIRYSSERLVKGNLVQITSHSMSARAYQDARMTNLNMTTMVIPYCALSRQQKCLKLSF